jgi:hypothetical protein
VTPGDVPLAWVSLLQGPYSDEFTAEQLLALVLAGAKPPALRPHDRLSAWRHLIHPFGRAVTSQPVSLKCSACGRLLDKVQGASGGLTTNKHGAGVRPLGTAALSIDGHGAWTYACKCGATWPNNGDRLAAAFVLAHRANVQVLVVGAPGYGLQSAALA